MVIVCVAGMLRTEVVEAAHRSGLAVHILTHGNTSPFTYAHVLMGLWDEPYEWVLCEQDTVPPPGALGAMVSCGEDWCTLPHWVGSHWDIRCLGVARFSLALRRRLPYAAQQALGPRKFGGPVRHHTVVDVELARVLGIWGVEPHVHQGHTRHLRRGGVESLVRTRGDGSDS